MKERRAKYSRFSPNSESFTPYGEMERNRIKKKKQSKNLISQTSFNGYLETYKVNHDILSEIRILYEQQRYSRNPEYVAISKMKVGLEKMEEKAKTMGIYPDMKVDSKEHRAEEKKAIIFDINEAKVLIETLQKNKK